MTTTKLTWLTGLRGADLTLAEFRVLISLATYANADGTGAHPGVDRLAADCCLSTRSVQRALRALVGLGAVTETMHGGNKVRKGFASVFAVNLRWTGEAEATAQNPQAAEPKGDSDDTKGDIDDTKGDTSVTPPGPLPDPLPGPLSMSGGNGRAPSPTVPFPSDWTPNHRHDVQAKQLGLELDEMVDEFRGTMAVEYEQRTDWDKTFGGFLNDFAYGQYWSMA